MQVRVLDPFAFGEAEQEQQQEDSTRSALIGFPPECSAKRLNAALNIFADEVLAETAPQPKKQEKPTARRRRREGERPGPKYKEGEKKSRVKFYMRASAVEELNRLAKAGALDVTRSEFMAKAVEKAIAEANDPFVHREDE